MATVVYNSTKDWFNIFELAGGDHFKSRLVGANLVNNTVTQAALNAAIISDAALVKSTDHIFETKENHEIIANPTTIALALLGDDASIATLQSMVSLTSPTTVLPTGGIGTLKSQYFIGVVPLLSPLPTTNTIIPFTTSSTKGITNLAGTLTIPLPGVYQLQFTAPLQFTNRHMLYIPTTYVNNIANPIAGELTCYEDNPGNTWPDIHSFNKTLVLTANSTIYIKHITDDTGGATYGADFSIVRIG